MSKKNKNWDLLTAVKGMAEVMRNDKFGTDLTLKQAYDNAVKIASASENKVYMVGAIHVLLNSLANQLDAIAKEAERESYRN